MRTGFIVNDGFRERYGATFKSEDKFLQCDHLNETSFYSPFTCYLLVLQH